MILNHCSHKYNLDTYTEYINKQVKSLDLCKSVSILKLYCSFIDVYQHFPDCIMVSVC